MKLIDTLKIRAKSLKKESIALYYAYKNPRMPLLPKMLAVFTLGYALSPIDLIPDFIPVIGYLDDLLILPALISLSIKLIPKGIMAEAREKAEAKPPVLKKNLIFGILFVLLWATVLGAVIFKCVLRSG